MQRQPILVFMGHVDSGKTSLQDYIRQSSVVEREAGKITQHIGASTVPLETVKRICGKLLDNLKTKINVPGILMVDSPGHAAFSNLRKRGGALADIAVLVIDIKEGIMPQTKESIEILKANKTPFVIALNKIDRINGWSSKKGLMLDIINQQSEGVRNEFEKRLYEILGKLHSMGFGSERFDRVEDFTKQIAMIPTSAITGEGIPELLMVVTGLAQKFLEQNLKFDPDVPGKGVILEVKETTGLGTTVDVILFDGKLKKNDIIVIGGLNAPIVTKIKALLEPAPLTEMREKKAKFSQINEAIAATGIKISANDLDEAVAGMPVWACNENDLEEVKKEIQEEVDEIVIETEDAGLILKADTLGSLEALILLFKEKNIPIRKATIGDISKKDVVEAMGNKDSDALLGCILGFNVNVAEDVNIYANANDIKIINSNIIYALLDLYEKWVEEKKKILEEKELEHLTRPGKIMLLKGYVFRQNNPAIVGSEVLQGSIKAGVSLMKKDGKKITYIKSIGKEKETLNIAKRGDQVAVSLPEVTVGRQIHEEDIFYTVISEEEFRSFKNLKRFLSHEEKELLKEIAEIMRNENPTWGI